MPDAMDDVGMWKKAVRVLARAWGDSSSDRSVRRAAFDLRPGVLARVVIIFEGVRRTTPARLGSERGHIGFGRGFPVPARWRVQSRRRSPELVLADRRLLAVDRLDPTRPRDGGGLRPAAPASRSREPAPPTAPQRSAPPFPGSADSQRGFLQPVLHQLVAPALVPLVRHPPVILQLVLRHLRHPIGVRLQKLLVLICLTPLNGRLVKNTAMVPRIQNPSH